MAHRATEVPSFQILKEDEKLGHRRQIVALSLTSYVPVEVLIKLPQHLWQTIPGEPVMGQIVPFAELQFKVKVLL